MTTPPTDKTSTERGKTYLDRLNEANGKRLIVDLDAAGKGALEKLLNIGYGLSNKEVVIKALTEAEKNNKLP